METTPPKLSIDETIKAQNENASRMPIAPEMVDLMLKVIQQL